MKASRQVRVRQYLWRLAEVVALILFVVLMCAFFLWSLKYTLPFVIGWFAAVLLLPLVRSLERHGVRRTPAALTVLLGIVILVAMVLGYAVFVVASEATVLSFNVSHYFRIAQNWVQHAVLRGQTWYGNLPPKVAVQIRDDLATALGQLENIFRSFISILIGSVTHLPETLFVVVISVITTYFMLVRREHLYRGFLKRLPPGWSAKVQVVVQDMLRAFVGTIRVQIVLMLLSAVLGVAGMWLLHVPYAAILGILFGLFGLVPVVGSALLTVPWAIGAALVGDVALGIQILALQLIISVIRHIVEPKILADSVGLDTLSTLFGLYVGLKLMGFLGLFLGPIVLIGIKSLLRSRLFIDFIPRASTGSQTIMNAQEAERPEASDGPTQSEESNRSSRASDEGVQGADTV